MRVLVVDDDPGVVSVLTKFLERLGHEVTVATTAARAVSLFAAERPELVVLDASLPDADGQSCLARLRAEDPAVRVIGCSGFSDAGPGRALMEAGACAFLQKPFRLADLTRALAEAVK